MREGQHFLILRHRRRIGLGRRTIDDNVVWTRNLHSHHLIESMPHQHQDMMALQLFVRIHEHVFYFEQPKLVIKKSKKNFH